MNSQRSDHPAGPITDHPAGPITDHPAGPITDHPAGPITDHPAGPLAEHADESTSERCDTTITEQSNTRIIQSLHRLQALQAEIAISAQQHARNPKDIALLVVSKTQPWEALIPLIQQGQRDFGENDLREAFPKIDQLQTHFPSIPLAWHFIGPIQSNKTRKIAEHFDWVHSVSREVIAQRLDHARGIWNATHANPNPLRVLIQVNIDADPAKSGCTPEETPQLMTYITQHCTHLQLEGLMTILEKTDSPAEQHASFQRLRQLRDALRTPEHSLSVLSMGMSQDWKPAIEAGSTLLRIGSLLFST